MRFFIPWALVAALLLQVIHLVDSAHAAQLHLVLKGILMHHLHLNCVIFVGSECMHFVQETRLLLLATQSLD